MNYEILSDDHGITIVFDGEIDMQYSPVVRQQILDQLQKAKPLNIDLRNVSYMDSSGIACLVEGLQQSRSKQLDFKLVAPQTQVLQVLKLARLDQVFTIVDDE